MEKKASRKLIMSTEQTNALRRDKDVLEGLERMIAFEQDLDRMNND